MEHRATPRLRTIKGGSILFGGTHSIDCVVRNLSETGALLALDSPLGIPDDFTLVIKPELTKRNCHIMWRRVDKIGVKFV